MTAPMRESLSSISPFDGVDVRENDLALRTLETADAPALFRLIDADRERLGRWLPWVEETRTEGDTVRFIADAADERRRRRSLVLGILIDDALAGTLGLHYSIGSTVRRSSATGSRRTSKGAATSPARRVERSPSRSVRRVYTGS